MGAQGVMGASDEGKGGPGSDVGGQGMGKGTQGLMGEPREQWGVRAGERVPGSDVGGQIRGRGPRVAMGGSGEGRGAEHTVGQPHLRSRQRRVFKDPFPFFPGTLVRLYQPTHNCHLQHFNGSPAARVAGGRWRRGRGGIWMRWGAVAAGHGSPSQAQWDLWVLLGSPCAPLPRAPLCRGVTLVLCRLRHFGAGI